MIGKPHTEEWNWILISYLIQNKLNKIKYLNLRPETINILEGKTGKTFLDIDLDKVFLTKNPNANAMKTKIHGCDLIKLKSFCTAKGRVSRVNRQTTAGEKIFTVYTSNKGLISRLFKEPKQISKNNTIPSKSGLWTWIDNSKKKILKWPTNIIKML